VDGPVIGITVSLDPGIRIRPGFDVLYVGRSYARAVRRAGGVPVLLPPDSEPAAALRLCRGLVVTGGGMLPESIGAPAAAAEPEQAERIDWDRRLLDAALAAQVPLLGVCYGMQLLNLHLGGTLFADLRDALPGALDHGGSGRMTEHPVELAAGSRLHALLGGGARVASSHRQAVARLGGALRLAARAPDGVVEAIEGQGALGVEWHAELDPTGPAIYGELVRRAREAA
jgi:gamma-glutamyl-gamma-aminobutyrate hydrolase PuuD